MSQPAQLLFMGLPSSGKTTFLAALWHVLSQRGDKTSLKLSQTTGERTYLNRIEKEWCDCKLVPRTNTQTDEVVVLHLQTMAKGQFDLVIPDLSGEAFEQVLADRRMSLAHKDLVCGARGILLFVNSEIQRGTQISQAAQLVASIGGRMDEAGTNTELATPWSVEKMPTQVKLVELLQMVLDQTGRKLRIALVVSAWDLVDSLGSPEVYLKRSLPLLHQFLEANDDWLEYSVFGVSAQGGDITVAKEKASLLERDDAVDRIKVRIGNESNNDITKPIAWLLENK